jgi:hypothetical protein
MTRKNLSKISSLDIDADNIIRKETYRLYTLLLVSVNLDLSRTA